MFYSDRKIQSWLAHFFNVVPETGLAREDSELVAYPGVVGGP